MTPTLDRPTREQILAEPAGRRLDAWVAVHVMGWAMRWFDRFYHNPDSKEEWHQEPVDSPEQCKYIAVACWSSCDEVDEWRPSCDLETAWQVVEEWEKRPGDFELRMQNGRFRATFFRPSREDIEWGQTAPLAICRAALLATLP